MSEQFGASSAEQRGGWGERLRGAVSRAALSTVLSAREAARENGAQWFAQQHGYRDQLSHSEAPTIDAREAISEAEKVLRAEAARVVIAAGINAGDFLSKQSERGRLDQADRSQLLMAWHAVHREEIIES